MPDLAPEFGPSTNEPSAERASVGEDSPVVGPGGDLAQEDALSDADPALVDEYGADFAMAAAVPGGSEDEAATLRRAARKARKAAKRARRRYGRSGGAKSVS